MLLIKREKYSNSNNILTFPYLLFIGIPNNLL